MDLPITINQFLQQVNNQVNRIGGWLRRNTRIGVRRTKSPHRNNGGGRGVDRCGGGEHSSQSEHAFYFIIIVSNCLFLSLALSLESIQFLYLIMLIVLSRYVLECVLLFELYNRDNNFQE